MNYGRELPGYPYNIKAKLTRCLIVAQRMLVGQEGAPFAHWSGQSPLPIGYRGQAASDAIKSLLERDAPCLVSRFGWLEMETVLRGFDIDDFHAHPLRQFGKFLIGESGPFWWDNSIRGAITWCAGYFPPDDESLMRFSRQMRDDFGQVDLLASYVGGETRMAQRFNPSVRTFPLGHYEPFWYDFPWTSAFKNKNILVITSFPDTVRAQYGKRKQLFRNPEMLPEFNLLTYRSISSLAGNEVPFKTWQDAFHSSSGAGSTSRTTSSGSSSSRGLAVACLRFPTEHATV